LARPAGISAALDTRKPPPDRSRLGEGIRRVRYYQQVLREDERLLFACRLHWIVFARAALLLIGGLILLIASTFFLPGTLPHLAILYAGDVLIVLSPFAGIAAWIRWYATDIAVTDRRVIYKRGLITRRTIEMNVSKIETVDVDQGVFGRMLDYGDVVIRGTGGTFEPLRFVGQPINLRNAILVG
jgi:uncharacterized membrane protein YdbT with pleckstrin-like domain